MTNLWIRLQVWVWIAAAIGAMLLLALLWQVVRFLLKRGALLAELRTSHRQGEITLRPCRPLWWLVDRRRGCDCLIDLKDPESGAVSYTLAVKLIPTLRRTTEYCIGDVERWRAKTNFLMPLPYGVIKLDFGYRKCLPRPVARVFSQAPCGSIPVYLFHPHPHALTLEMRGVGRRYRRRVIELSVPHWTEEVLLLDLNSLRKLETASREGQAGILEREEVRSA
jgi:hypothetical protein